MHKRYVISSIFVFIILLCGFQGVRALDVPETPDAKPDGVVISQVQTGSLDPKGSLSEELIEIFNNSDNDIDITNWRIGYGLSGDAIPTKTIKTLVPLIAREGRHIFLPARSPVLLVSKTLAEKNTDLKYDYQFSGGMVDNGHWLSVVNIKNENVDLVEWGALDPLPLVATAEGGVGVSLPMSGQLIQRKALAEDKLQDTDNNFNDFESAPAREVYEYGAIYYSDDVCSNIDGIQESAAPDYVFADNGDCVPAPVPEPTCDIESGKEIGKDGECLDVRACPNLPTYYTEVPAGYKKSADGICLLDLLPISISELLPNVNGVDDGSEFIELFNPNDSEVDLVNYNLSIGEDGTKNYAFPAGSKIGAGKYMAFYNKDIKFTLLNTQSSVSLQSVDGQIVDAGTNYSAPKEDISWSLIDGVWQYTNQLTPGLKNLPSIIQPVEEILEDDILEPCAANQYRNPETNRCRLIVASTATLAPCKDGQYRSEETNRCRNIVSDVVDLVPCAEGQERNPETNRCRNIIVQVSELVPCKDGQYRSEETNRCRNIVSDIVELVACAEGQERNPATNRCRSIGTVLGASDLVPCKEGQERNPETNRCRNIASAVPEADYAPEKVAVSQNNNSFLFALVAIGTIVAAYGVWEWRREIAKLAKKIAKLFHKIK